MLYYHRMQGHGKLIRALVVDDEPLACDELAYLLQAFPEVEVLGSAANGLEAVQKIEATQPNLVFLDVQMPGLNGLGVIRKLREKGLPLPLFVLVTAYDHYAVEAFREQALDYLLKPVDRERLAQTIERALKALEATPGAVIERVRPQVPRQKLLIRVQNRNFVVDANDVVYATIQDGVIRIVTRNFEGQSNFHTLEELQANLDPNIFWRVHRSYLVNINRIREVVPWFKSTFQIRVDDRHGTEIPVSRSQTKRLRELFRL